jgi:hypothetical protein
LRKILGVARHRHLRRTGAHEDRQNIREPIAGAKCLAVFARFRYANFARKMALLTNTVPLSGGKLRGIYHPFARGNVIASRAVASLASCATFPKRR